MKKLVLLFVTIPLLSFAQLREGEISISNDYANKAIQTKDKGFVIAGVYNITASIVAANIIKLDSNGNIKWDKIIKGSSNCTANDLVQTKDGGYATVGYTQSYGAGGEDVYVVKLDSAGNLQWTRTIGGPDDDWGNSIVQTKDGGYAITGGTKSFGGGVPGLADIWVIKLDSVGNKKWTKTIEGPWGPNDDGRSIVKTYDGGYAIGGSIADNLGYGKVFICKIDSTGNIVWFQAIGGAMDEEGYDAIQTLDSGYVITGLTSSFGVEGAMYIVKLNSNGNLAWGKIINDSSAGYSVVQAKDSGIIVAGNYTNGYFCKLDIAGNLLWARMFNNNAVSLSCINQTIDGGYCAAGYSGSGIIFLKTDSLGKSCDVKASFGIIHSGGVVTSGGTITSSNNGKVDSGGTIGNGGVLSDICIGTYVSDLGLEDGTLKVYPNPNTGKFYIHSQNNNLDGALVEIYNVFGETIFSRYITLGGDDLKLDLSSQPCGMYFIRMTAEKEIFTNKIIIQK